MGKRKETLSRERREHIGDQLATLLMRLYILHNRHDGQGVDALSGGKAWPKDMAATTWTIIAGAMLDAGWKPPDVWEERSRHVTPAEGGLPFPVAEDEE